MDANVRRRALLAAAKVAMSFSVVGAFGCSAAATDEDDRGASSSEDKATVARASSTAGDGGAAPACRLPEPLPVIGLTTDGGASPFGKEAAACCSDLILANTGLEPLVLGIPEPGNPGAAACCRAATHAGLEVSPQALSACCQVSLGFTSVCCMNDFTSPGCTPWGPPMPPAMPESLLLEVA